MNEEKMSSDEVPGKFTEWLLAMGCPADKVPSQNKIVEMCRGQYYMVWRSLMEQVDARDVVREKRMQVFCDDVRRCQKNNVFSQHDSSVIVPEQLSLWKQQSDLKEQVENAKTCVTLARRDLDQLMDKISNKLAQRVLSRTRVEDLSRRVWLLRQVAADLSAKKTNLEETRTIADSLCSNDDDADIETKLDKCLTAYRRQNNQPPSLSNSNTSTTSNIDEFEEQVYRLVKCRGDALCAGLYERRAALVQALATGGATPKSNKNKLTPQSVLAHTAALHCTLMLEAAKNKVHLKQTRKKLLSTITELNNYLSGESCELLVIRCEQTHTSARVTALRTLLDELTTNSGIFHTASSGTVSRNQTNTTHTIDKAIEMKREELKRVMAALSSTERKVQSARDCLQLIYGAFRADASHTQPSHYRGIQLDLPTECIPSLVEFYSRRREDRRRRVNLSMELEVSDGSLTDLIDYNNPRFVDELRIYLKKFNLEKNRQLVLESGEKIWTFETIQSSIHRLYSAWTASEVSCNLLCPSYGLGASVSRTADAAQEKTALEATVRGLQGQKEIHGIDITAEKEEEQQITDRTKKRLRENLLELQKTNKVFALAEENLKFWADNNIRKHISQLRKHDGMTYKDYEAYYMENLVCQRM